MEVYLFVAYKSLYKSSEKEVSPGTLKTLATTLVGTIKEINAYTKEGGGNRTFCFVHKDKDKLLALGETTPYLIDKKTNEMVPIAVDSSSESRGTKSASLWKDCIICANPGSPERLSPFDDNNVAKSTHTFKTGVKINIKSEGDNMQNSLEVLGDKVYLVSTGLRLVIMNLLPPYEEETFMGETQFEDLCVFGKRVVGLTRTGAIMYVEKPTKISQLPVGGSEVYTHVKNALDNILVAKFDTQTSVSTLLLLDRNLRVRFQVALKKSTSHIRTIAVSRMKAGYRIAWILQRQTHLDVVLIANNRMAVLGERPPMAQSMNFAMTLLTPHKPNTAIVSLESTKLQIVTLDKRKGNVIKEKKVKEEKEKEETGVFEDENN